MPQSHAFLTFNRGLISRLGLARLDIARGRLSAQTMSNWMPRVLGSMMLRPGLAYLGSTANNAAARVLPFVFAVDDKALLELTVNLLRVWIDDALVSRPTVTTTVTNGGFEVNVSGWVDNDEAGGTSVWVAGGYLGLTGNGTAAAIRDQEVTVSAPNQNVEHGLRIVVARGPVVLRVGSTAGGEQYVEESELETGTHSLAFTPTGNFHVRLLSRLKRQVLVDSVAVDLAGVLTLPTPWLAADLDNVRYDQSGDVVFVACVGYTQRRIERRATRSWSVVQYLPPDGPFRVENIGPITITPGATSGNTTLTASAALFRSTHAPSANNAGALFRLGHGTPVVYGVARVTAFTSSTVVNAEVIADFSAATATAVWAEGEWSNFRGWPSALAFHESRLAHAGKAKVQLSESDAFDAFDPATEGDAASISRSIGSGPVDRINWLMSLERLLLGGQGAEWSARSSSLDEPLTPTNFNLKPASTQGSRNVDALKLDKTAAFVQRSGTRVYQLSLEADPAATDYGAIDLTQLVPEVGEPSIVRAAIQRQPDTRLHFVRSDGVAAVLVFDKTENTICWLEVESDGASGAIEDVCVLPGTSIEDQVYYVVRRTIGGATKRYLERWAQESEARGGAGSRLADSFIAFGAGNATITGLGHLEGQSVVVWSDSTDVGTATFTATSWTQTHTVTGGQITLTTVPAVGGCVGLPYRARWQSGKLALAAALGTPLTKRKRLAGFGAILADAHVQGLLYGRDFSNMDPLPLIREGAPVTVSDVLADVEDGSLPFPGEWSTDSRLCLEARAPRPMTVVCTVVDAELREQV